MFILINSKLKKDMKMTNIEELQIQSETYYQEVMYSVLINHYLQPLLQVLSCESNHWESLTLLSEKAIKK